jgi:hypothetical protein
LYLHFYCIRETDEINAIWPLLNKVLQTCNKMKKNKKYCRNSIKIYSKYNRNDSKVHNRNTHIPSHLTFVIYPWPHFRVQFASHVHDKLKCQIGDYQDQEYIFIRGISKKLWVSLNFDFISKPGKWAEEVHHDQINCLFPIQESFK